MSWQDELIVGKQDKPPRFCIYGAHGIGKSSLGLGFPSPIFISTEGGLDALNATSFPQAATLDDVKQNIGRLMKDEHGFQTVVLDTVDWLVEPLITAQIDANYDAKEQAYGKGQMLVAEEFRNVLQGLDKLRIKRNMNVVVIAHSEIRRFDSPLTEPYDQFRPKLPQRCNALLQEWTDVLAFAAFQVVVKKADVGFNREARRGVSTGDRSLHLVETAGYVAKCRYPGSPDQVPMSKNAEATVKHLAKYIPIVGVNSAT